MYDVAFTVMDLEERGWVRENRSGETSQQRRGRGDAETQGMEILDKISFTQGGQRNLGNAFLNTYLEQTGDWEGLPVLPLYLSRQAYVRGKVTSFLIDDPAIPQQAKQEAMATASKYYRLAWEYSKIHQGRLFLMSGLSGSGKTTVARQLARHLGAIHLRTDAVRKQLAGIPLEQRGGKELYTEAMSQKTYDRLLELGIMLANEGLTVILDGKYDRQNLRGKAIQQANEHQLPLQIIHCTAPESVLRDRLTARTGDISDATADLLQSQQAAAEPFTDAEQSLVTTLDTTRDWLSFYVSNLPVFTDAETRRHGDAERD
ncbi:MAG: AAA family ATPase [Symploca sp. SIO2D2]|nr:AAA family ATPase [Symploca sp. SIO2D2]